MPRPVSPRRLVLLLAALVLTGCGTVASVAEIPAKVLVQRAAAKTAAADSMRVFFTAVMEGPGLDGSFRLTGNGVVVGKRARVTMKLPELPDGTKLGRIATITTGKAVYVHVPALAREVPGAKPWIRVGFADLTKQSGVDLGALLQASSKQNAKETLDALGAIATVEKVGRDDSRGAPVTQYRAVVDYARYARLLERRGDKQAAAAVRLVVSRFHLRRMPMDVWVDDASRVRRLRFSQPFPTGEGKGTMTIAMEFYGFGAKLRVAVPPRDRVTNLSDLMKLSA